MKFVMISDTHGQHESLTLPAGDVIIHAGDVSARGGKHEIENFLGWFESLEFKYKIFIAGNHDFFFERNSPEEIEKIIPDNVTYLCDSGIKIEQLQIWGSPITPWFYDWAFNRNRGKDIARHWNLIPPNTDILITHGPAHSIHDETVYGEHVGCEDLLQCITANKPKIHLCGHIHEAYGQTKIESTLFINASVLNQNYILKNDPVVVTI